MIVSEYYLSAQITFTVWTSTEAFHSQEKLSDKSAKETLLLILAQPAQLGQNPFFLG